MSTSLQSAKFKDIFKNSLRLNARSMSVKTLLSERNLKRIDYSPYYQRNYVWDNAKQTFFLESVILGTEIPPLILFKTGAKIEVIDGRQRFETLKRFKENNITLKVNGLKELKGLDKQSFNKLSPVVQESFLDSNIRVFEFEVINQPNLEIDTLDRIKKEIFRRYNTGITPLNRSELDNAKYDNDEFSDLFKDKLKKEFNFLENFNQCFFPKETVIKNGNNDELIAKNVDFIRRYRVLCNFPISKYAGGNKIEFIDLLYDFAKNNTEDNFAEFERFNEIIKIVLDIFNELSSSNILKNKLIYECILWAITIIKQENLSFVFDPNLFKEHYIANIGNYSEDSSHYYKNILTRFTDTAKFFQRSTKFNFFKHIRNEYFTKKINELKQTEVDAAKSLDELENLRLHKPNPISTPIDEIRTDLKSKRYLLRPSYQRQEKVNVLKASSIIESILLGINLPPIFIYKKKSGVKEVVDGQQRLLSIIGFLGEQYFNEDGELSYSKNNFFKLKDLKILTEYEGDNFSALPIEQQDKIIDFVIDLIIIEEGANEGFDPIDLFIRLNYKPYPIKNNTFEMWNSIVNQEVITKIKSITANRDISTWFYLREILEGKPDRMFNEEMITILSYINYNNKKSKVDNVIGFFPRQDRITCRLKNKKAISDLLINDIDTNELIKLEFLQEIDRTTEQIFNLKLLFNSEDIKDELNNYLNVKHSRTYRRSLQDFYVIWLLIYNIPSIHFKTKGKEILADIRSALSLLRNTELKKVDESYLKIFQEKLDSLSKKHSEIKD